MMNNSGLDSANKDPMEKKLPLLRLLLAAMPETTRSQVHQSFSQVNANIEFATWIHPHLYGLIVPEANKMGFVTWQNKDLHSVFLYGAGAFPLSAAWDIIDWLQQITFPGQKGQIIIGNETLRLSAVLMGIGF